MASTEPDELEGVQMDDQEIDEYLQRMGHGVLSLADRNEAYSVPLSFGYNGGSQLYFIFVPFSYQSRKTDLIKRTDRASFLVYDVASKFDWRSVIISGPLEEVGDSNWDELMAAIEDNAWFPSAFSQAEPRRDLVGVTLHIEDMMGRMGKGGVQD